MNLYEEILHHGTMPTDKATLQKYCDMREHELEELCLMRNPRLTSKIIASGVCRTAHELLIRVCKESCLSDQVRRYTKRKTEIAVPEDDESNSEPLLLLPIAEKLIAEGKAPTYPQLLSQLAVIVLQAHNDRLQAEAAGLDPLLQ